MVTRSEESITLNGILPVFLTMVADSSRPLMMTINVSFIMTCFPKIVIQNGGKNALWEGRESGTMTRSEESVTPMTAYRECRFYQKTKKLSAYR